MYNFIKQIKNMLVDKEIRNKTKFNIDKYIKLKDKYKELIKENRKLKKQIKGLKQQINNLESILNTPKPKHAGERPKKFTDEQIEQMREYRKQGKSYNEIAKILNCSVGSVFDKLK